MRGYPHSACYSTPYLHAYNMLDMNVTGERVRGVSTTYKTTVGKVAANMSVIIAPEADHVNTSIWPGVSMKIYLHSHSSEFVLPTHVMIHPHPHMM